MRSAWQVGRVRKTDPRARGLAGQVDRRQVEREVRRSAVVFRRWSVWHGLTRSQAARRLDLSEVTLGSWEADWKRDRMKIVEVGRKATRADRELRNLLFALFQLAGDGVGVATYQAFFPEMSRREIEDIRRRTRSMEYRKGFRQIFALRWKAPGRVWAVDFTEVPVPVDGKWPYLFVVRDLATGMQLLSLPVDSQSAEAAAKALISLFLEHGAPLVLKSDNGSAFIGEVFCQVLTEWDVVQLFSPPYLPRYNGAIEAGVGSVKIRTHHESARHDRPGFWTCDDVEGARQMANECPRWWEPYEPTPRELWLQRTAIPAQEREVFGRTLAALREEIRTDRGIFPDFPIGRMEQASIDREAISRALVASGMLEFRRRRVSLGIKSGKRANVS